MQIETTFKQAQMVVPVVALAVIWLLEGWFPLFTERRGRTRHALRNLTLGLTNAALTSLAFAGLTALAVHHAERAHIGLLRWLEATAWIETMLALLLLDGWMYLWHRANHLLPFFWRFHRVHHSDPMMDVTTATRFHVGEIVLSSLLRLIVCPLLGVAFWHILLYETLLFPVILLHHSNIHIPELWDRRLRRLIVSPNMHRVHHSRWQPETDSNFASIFSFWDRLAGTFRQREDPHEIVFGLEGYDEDARQSVIGMLQTPFLPRPARSASAGRAEHVADTQAV